MAEKQEEPMHISRRKLITTAAATAALYLADAPMQLFGRRSAHAAKGGRLKIGVIAPSHCALSLVHASLSGKFKKNGIDAEIAYLPDVQNIAKGLISGELAAGQIMSPVFYAINTGSGPFKGSETPLVTAQVGGTNGGVLVVGKDSSIKLPKDLSGKSIGVHSPLMVHSLLINALLKRNNIDPVKDVNTKVINMSDLVQALKDGKIEAFINPEPLGTVAITKGVGRELMVTKNLWPKHPCCVIAVRKDFYRGDPDTVEALYTSSLESGLTLNRVDTRDEALALVNKDSKPYSQIPLKTLQLAFLPGRSDFDPFPYKSFGKAVMIMMRDYKILAKTVDIDKVASDTVLSDLSRKVLGRLGGDPPRENNRQERIVGEIVV
jgi:nitrate/nitrite transport system substrate-binding protein